MDKIISARVDEFTVRQITMLANQLHTTKKHVIESAVRTYAEKVEEKQNVDLLHQTFGAWRRNESVKETVTKARKAFRRSMLRHQT